MTKCKKCGKDHPVSYHLEDKIPHGGYPRSQKGYKSAHNEANKAEKAIYPKGYEKMKHIDAKLSKKEDAGTNTKTGKIEVSKKVPRVLRQEVAYHEKIENKKLRKKSG